MSRPKGAKGVPWACLVRELRAHPGRWILFPEMGNVSERTIATIRRREVRALRLDDGVIRCRRKATAWTDEGSVRVALILKFEPKEKP